MNPQNTWQLCLHRHVNGLCAHWYMDTCDSSRSCVINTYLRDTSGNQGNENHRSQRHKKEVRQRSGEAVVTPLLQPSIVRGAQIHIRSILGSLYRFWLKWTVEAAGYSWTYNYSQEWQPSPVQPVQKPVMLWENVNQYICVLLVWPIWT